VTCSAKSRANHTRRAYWALRRLLLRRIGLTALLIAGWPRQRSTGLSGTGSPKVPAGENIPETARIFAIADVFDAHTARRPYKEPLGYDKKMNIMEPGRDSHFDARLLDASSGSRPHCMRSTSIGKTGLRTRHWRRSPTRQHAGTLPGRCRMTLTHKLYWD